MSTANLVNLNFPIVAALLLGACATTTPPPLKPLPLNDALLAPTPSGIYPAVLPATDLTSADLNVRTVIVPGAPPSTSTSFTTRPPAGIGDVSINLPAADLATAARAVIGDILGRPYTITPGTSGNVTLVTPRPIPRASVLPLFEEALRGANLAIVTQGEVLTITSIEAARNLGTAIGGDKLGYATETIRLQFVQADEMKRLLDPIVSNVIQRTEPTQNALVISGTTGQRQSLRDLLKQFDVNWLRGMSFALLVPQRTDSRIIVPELDKLLNAADAPTRGLVRLISMEKLNGILAISSQPQYLEDVRRFVEILDREGQNNERRLFVYRVQNGRSADLARTLNAAFGTGSNDSSTSANPRAAFDTATDGNAASAADAARSAVLGNAPATNPAGSAAGSGRTNTLGGTNSSSNEAGGSNINARISSDETNNAVIVFGTPRDYAVIEDALRRLDTLPYQVMIEAAITEVTLNDAMRYGVQWNFQQGNGNFALSGGDTATAARQFPGFSFFFANSGSISAVLNALEEKTDVNVVSAPKLLVLNNQTAALQVGDQVPVATASSQSVTAGNAPIVNSIEYRDTGVILKVTPRVNAGGLVLLDIAQEVSDVQTNTTSGINSPTISTRRIATSIAVQDGQVIALGGLIRDTSSRGKNGLPYLSRIPIIGGLLFGNVKNSDKRTELLVLLRPRVIRNSDDGRAITDELRDKIRSVRPVTTGGTLP